MDCDKSNSGCDGGLPERAYKAIQEMGGLELEEDYEYYYSDYGECRFEKDKVWLI